MSLWELCFGQQSQMVSISCKSKPLAERANQSQPSFLLALGGASDSGSAQPSRQPAPACQPQLAGVSNETIV